MVARLRTFFLRFVILLNFILAAGFLVACLAPYLDPRKWWFISWLGFIFPILLILLSISIFFWLFFKPRYSLLFLVVLLMGWKSISVFFAFHLSKEFHYQKPADVLRVVTWNVARFVEIKKNNNAGSQIRLKMMEQLLHQDADILCLQEFHSSALNDYYDNISYIRKKLRYPYFYFSFDEDGAKQYYSSIIFSRVPIIDSGILYYPSPSLHEPLIHADVKFNGDTIRIFTTHLQSVQFKKRDYQRINEIKNYEDSIVSNSKTIFSKLKKGIERRSVQANFIRDQVRKSQYPVVFCGDFNDVPNSYTYFTVRGNMQDAFLEKGSGIGRSFTSIAPTLRIDYILASKDFSVLQFDRISKKYSDHYMLVTDLKLRTVNR
jgi:endonuclease/exonuclease/phosphatase family metal-dependent hydrolase